jgi:hypothetical protein
MSNNVYNPKYNIPSERSFKTGTDLFYNSDYTVFSNLFNLIQNTNNYSVVLSFENTFKELKNSRGNQLKTVLDLNKRIEDWLSDVPTNVSYISYFVRHSPTDFYKILTENTHFQRCGFRRSYIEYRIGYYSLMKGVTEEMYFALVVKKEYIKYVKLCVFLGEPIMEDCFEFWYDEHMVLASGDTKIIKSLAKILKEFSLKEIPCIPKQNILSLFQPEIKFTAPSISQQKEMINEFAEEFTKHELSLIK